MSEKATQLTTINVAIQLGKSLLGDNYFLIRGLITLETVVESQVDCC